MAELNEIVEVLEDFKKQKEKVSEYTTKYNEMFPTKKETKIVCPWCAIEGKEYISIEKTEFFMHCAQKHRKDDQIVNVIFELLYLKSNLGDKFL